MYHYFDVIMGMMASQITSFTIVYSTVYSAADQRKHQSSTSLAFVWGIHRWAVNSLHKLPVMRKMFPFDDVIMFWKLLLPVFIYSSMWVTSMKTHNNFCFSIFQFFYPLESYCGNKWVTRGSHLILFAVSHLVFWWSMEWLFENVKQSNLVCEESAMTKNPAESHHH